MRTLFLERQVLFFLFRSLLREQSLRRKQKQAIALRFASEKRKFSISLHNTRCVLSGRSRQAFRKTRLARMAIRQLMSEGRLTGYRLART